MSGTFLRCRFSSALQYAENSSLLFFQSKPLFLFCLYSPDITGCDDLLQLLPYPYLSPARCPFKKGIKSCSYFDVCPFFSLNVLFFRFFSKTTSYEIGSGQSFRHPLPAFALENLGFDILFYSLDPALNLALLKTVFIDPPLATPGIHFCVAPMTSLTNKTPPNTPPPHPPPPPPPHPPPPPPPPGNSVGFT